MKRLNKMIVCLGALLVFSMGLNFSAHTIYGNLYKRKYNRVTGEWVGKWMPV